MKLTIHTAHGKPFYRCGLRFGKEPVTIDTADLKLSKADVKRLFDEPMLVVEELEEKPETGPEQDPNSEPEPESESKKKSKRKK